MSNKKYVHVSHAYEHSSVPLDLTKIAYEIHKKKKPTKLDRRQKRHGNDDDENSVKSEKNYIKEWNKMMKKKEEENALWHVLSTWVEWWFIK